MKIQILESVEVSDDQRKALAALIDGPGAKKRIATREELKAYIWRHGRDWEIDLADDSGTTAVVEDLIGGDQELGLDDLL